MFRFNNTLKWKTGTLLIVSFAILFLVGSTPVSAENLESTPREQLSPAPIFGAAPEGIAAPLASPALPFSSSSLVTTGLNFKASELFNGSGFIPPDTMGAVGPNHIVLMINGQFAIFNKTTGNRISTRSLDSFWTSVVGLAITQNNNCVSGTCSRSGDTCTTTADCPTNFTFDPRIVFDLASGRWFACSDSSFDGNDLYVARSDTDDPTGTWQGAVFAADTVGAAEFHDYPTLAVSADGLFICTNDFDAGGNKSCYSIPKADLLQSPPSISNMTRFEATPSGLPQTDDGSVQPALDFGTSVGREPLLSTFGGKLHRSNIFGAGAAGATLGAETTIAGDPGHAPAPAARQPSKPAGVTIENVTPRFVANVIKQGDSLWAVHAVHGSFSNSAVRWYEINEPNNTMLQTGLIENAGQDFHEPSIQVNEFGHVVIGYTCSGPSLNPSSCVSVGETVNGVTTFEAPTVLAAGAGYYYRDFRDPTTHKPTRNRWGDYSATVIDPVDACTFWTFQEFVSVGATSTNVGPFPGDQDGKWGVQVTQLTFTPPVITIPGNINLPDACVGRTSTATLNVCNTTANTGPCADLVIDDITSSDPQFVVTTPSSGYPLVISPNFCFPFQVRFTPSSIGAKSAVLTIASNDPINPSVAVQATGNGTQQKIAVTGSTDFGNVCPGTPAEKTISVCDVGACDLHVTGATITCSDFTLVKNPFPNTVSPDSCLNLVIRFTPTSAGPKSCTLVITSDDPANSSVTLTVTGNTPTASINVPSDLGFPATVIQSVGACSSGLPFPISNTGSCNLSITNIAITTDTAEYSLSGLPSFPIILEPGHVAGSGALNTVFAPRVLGRSDSGTLTVTYETDPITHATASVTRALCGEGVRTGARVLVTSGGVPLATVEKIQLQRINANRNKNLIDTNDVAKDVALQTVAQAAPCASFQYHREYGTVSNPIQLLPGSYQVTATGIVNGKRVSRTVGFNLDTCGFNANIVINF